MTELKMFIAMLTRAGIGHGLRHDYNPPGTGVQVEHGETQDEWQCSDWWFDESGKLVSVGRALEDSEG